MDGFSVGDIQLPADFDQQIAAQLAAQGYNFAVQPGATAAPATAAPATTAPNFAVQSSMPPATAASNFAVPSSAPLNPAFNIDKSGMVNEQGMGENPPTFAVQPTKVDETNFTVLGNNPTRKFGQAPDGKYYFEGKEITPQDFAVLKQTNDTYLASRPAPNLAVANATGTAAPTNLTVAGATGAVPIGPGVTLNPQGLTNPEVPTITATPAAPFDYSRLSTGEPQLVAAGASYKNNATGQMVPAGTDHYVTYTNDGDFAGTVMVAPGQKIRMVDAIDGSVVFEGTGPEGAKQATALANTMSQDKGRKAAWKIEAENEQGGYTTQASERYDPKKQSFFGKLADIALPIIGIALALTPGGQAILAGMIAAGGSVGLSAAAVSAGVGAAAGSTLSSVGQGRSLKDTALRAAISGVGAGAGAQFFPAAPAGGLSPASGVNGIQAMPLPGVVNFINTPQTLAEGIARIGGEAIAPTLGEVLVTGARTAAPTLGTKIASSVGALAPDLISGSGTNSLQGSPANDTVPKPQFASDEIVVTMIKSELAANPNTTLQSLIDAFPGVSRELIANTFNSSAPKADPAKTDSAKTDPAVNEIEGVDLTYAKDAARSDLFDGMDLASLIKKYGPDVANAAVTATKEAAAEKAASDKAEADKKAGDLEGVVVTAQRNAALTTLQKTLIFGGLITPATLAAQLSASGVPTTEAEAKTLMDSTKAPLGVAANVIGAGAVAAGALGGGGSGGSGSGSGGLTVGTPGSPGTLGSLSAGFREPLDLSKYAVRTPRDMSGVDFSNYGVERSFFSDVPQLPESAYAVRPSATLAPQQASLSATQATLPTTEARLPSFSTIQYQLAQEKGLPPAPTGKRYIKRDDGEIILVDDSPDATYKGRSGTVKRVRDLSIYQGGSTNKPRSDFAAANLPEVIANLRSVGGLPMKRGGRAQFAVTGSGTGRSDSIPAVLSDGEYVMDAETVALLGDGSSKAGAAKLDQFRVSVRKHKGRDLARGKFSVNAKRPEAYLSGGAS